MLALTSIQADTSSYTKNDNGELVKISSDTSNVYIKENGVLRVVEDLETDINTALALIAEVKNDIKQCNEAIDNYDPTIATATKQELKVRTHIAEQSLEEAERLLTVMGGVSKVATGAYMLAIGNVLRQGIIIVTATTATVAYSPILGTTVMIGGMAIATLGIYELYNELKEI